MTSPATFNTPIRLIQMARSDAGLLQEGDDPSSEQIADNMNRLNDIMNFAQTQGIKLWLQYDLSVQLVSGQVVYTIGPGGSISMTKPTRIIDSCYFVDSSGAVRTLDLISQDEYVKLSNKEQPGGVNTLWVKKDQNVLTVSVWPSPDANSTQGLLHLIIQQQVQNVVSITDSMNFPSEWFLYLRWAMADEICTGQPPSIMTRCAQKHAFYKEALENWDVEDVSVTFSMDFRADSRGSFV